MHCWPQDNAVTHCLNNADQHNVQTPVQIPKLILLFKVGSSYQIRIYFRVKTSLFWPKSIIRFTHFVLEIQRRGKNGGGKMKWKKSPKFLQLVKIKLRVYFFGFEMMMMTMVALNNWLASGFTDWNENDFDWFWISLLRYYPHVCLLHLSSLFKSSLCLSVSYISVLFSNRLSVYLSVPTAP